MRTSLILATAALFAWAAVSAQEERTDDVMDADDGREKEQEQGVETAEPPPQFIPTEKISLDQVISFPADI